MIDCSGADRLQASYRPGDRKAWLKLKKDYLNQVLAIPLILPLTMNGTQTLLPNPDPDPNHRPNHHHHPHHYTHFPPHPHRPP